MANHVEEIFQSRKVFVANEVIAEVIYVLDGVYSISKEDISDLLLEFIDFENILVSDKKALKYSLEIFKTKNLDFVDSLLCAYSKEDEILTFDKKLNSCVKNTK
jgi:predicted nucleic-acid-binding protein